MSPRPASMQRSRKPLQSSSPCPYSEETRIASALVSIAALMKSSAGVSAPRETTLKPAFSSAMLRMRLPTMCVSEPMTPVTRVLVPAGRMAASGMGPRPRRRVCLGADRNPCYRRVVENRLEPRCERDGTAILGQRLPQEAGRGLEEAVHLAGVVDRAAGDAGFRPAADLGRDTVA